MRSRRHAITLIVLIGKGPAAGSSKTKVSNKDVKPAKPAEKKWTPQDDAARKIQTCYRGHLARKARQKKIKEKEEYEILMDKLEKEVHVYVLVWL